MSSYAESSKSVESRLESYPDMLPDPPQSLDPHHLSDPTESSDPTQSSDSDYMDLSQERAIRTDRAEDMAEYNSGNAK